jgi:hypothetical protein
MTFASALGAFNTGPYSGALAMLAGDGEAIIVHWSFSARHPKVGNTPLMSHVVILFPFWKSAV